MPETETEILDPTEPVATVVEDIEPEAAEIVDVAVEEIAVPAQTPDAMVRQGLNVSVTAFGSVFFVLAIFFLIVKYLTRNEWKDKSAAKDA